MAREPPDTLIADLIDLGGAGLRVVELGGPAVTPAAGAGVVIVGVHRSGPLPDLDPELFDILLSAAPDAPAPWVGVEALDDVLAHLQAVADRQPAAVAIAAQVLRTTLTLPFEQALVQESLAYSALLASAGFRAWRAGIPMRDRGDGDVARLGVTWSADRIMIILMRPKARNAFDARMRDSLVDALGAAIDHPDLLPVILAGEGPCFSAGGDLDEFGSASDIGEAHLIRTLRSPARLAHQLSARLTVRLHGACVGAGIEVPAAAGRVMARPGASFRLPEVSMGLIPGAGGTATIPRRIGRHRACYMAISGREVDHATALAWALVDEVEA